MSRPWATLPIKIHAQIGQADQIPLGTVDLAVKEPESWDEVFELNLSDVLRVLQQAVSEYQE